MKRLIYSILTVVTLLLLSNCNKKDNTNLTILSGKLASETHDTIYLYGTDRFYDKLDTILVHKEGNFNHELVVDTPIIANLIIDSAHEYIVFISPFDKLNINYNELTNDYEITGNQLNTQYREFEEELSLKSDEEKTNAARSFIENNPSSLMSVALLYQYFIQKEEPDYEEIKRLIDIMTGLLKDRQAITQIIDQLERARRAKVTRSALFFNLPNTKGKRVDKKEYRDKLLLLHYWASWDQQSRELNKQLRPIHKKWGKNKDFVLVGIALDKDTVALKEAIKTDSITWEQLIDRDGWQSEVADRYGIMKLPTTFLINKNNAIIARDLAIDSLTNKISDILKP